VKGEVLKNLHASWKKMGKKQKVFELQRNGDWRGVEREVAGFRVQNARS
jgi:hypothetical protein